VSSSVKRDKNFSQTSFTKDVGCLSLNSQLFEYSLAKRHI
jgi:hypothetical protein